MTNSEARKRIQAAQDDRYPHLRRPTDEERTAEVIERVRFVESIDTHKRAIRQPVYSQRDVALLVAEIDRLRVAHLVASEVANAEAGERNPALREMEIERNMLRSTLKDVLDRAEQAESALTALRERVTALAERAKSGADAWGACSHEWARIEELAALLDQDATPPSEVRCDTCGDTGRIDWMIEADPNLYQSPDDDGTIACPDCAALDAQADQ